MIKKISNIKVHIDQRTNLLRPSHPLSVFRFTGNFNQRIDYVGWLAHRNFGDEVLAHIARQQLHNLYIVNIYPRRKIEDTLIRALFRESAPRALIIGGGTLIGGPYIDAIHSSNRPHIPVYTLGTGVGSPYTLREPRKGAWLKLLLQAKKVSVRGPLSKNTMEESFGVDNASIIGDTGLQVQRLWPKSGANDEKSEKRIAINICSSSYGDNAKDKVIHRAVYNFIAGNKRSAEFVAFPMQRNDLSLIKELFKSLGIRKFKCIAPFNNASEIRYIANCDVVISQRLHGSILAHGYGVPAVGLEYHSKVSDHFASMNLEQDCLEGASISGGRIQEAIRFHEEHDLRPFINESRDRLVYLQDEFTASVRSEIL